MICGQRDLELPRVVILHALPASFGCPRLCAFARELCRLLFANRCCSLVNVQGGKPPSLTKTLHSPRVAVKLRLISSSSATSYNWSPGIMSAEVAKALATSGLEYVPMIWGEKDLDDTRLANLDAFKGAEHLLGFNEPNFNVQVSSDRAGMYTDWIVELLLSHVSLAHEACCPGSFSSALSCIFRTSHRLV